MTAHLMQGMELRLCFATSLLSWTLLRFCVTASFLGKVFGSKTKLILLGKWPRSSPDGDRTRSSQKQLPVLMFEVGCKRSFKLSLESQHEIQNLRPFNSCVKNRKYKASSLRTSSAFCIKVRKFKERVKTAKRLLNVRKGKDLDGYNSPLSI